MDITLPKDLDSIKTKSVGVKNTLTETVSFNVSTTPPSASGTTLTDAHAFLYIGLFLLWIAIFGIGFAVGVPELILFDGIFGILLGIGIIVSDVPLHLVIGLTFALFNSVLMVLAFRD